MSAKKRTRDEQKRLARRLAELLPHELVLPAGETDPAKGALRRCDAVLLRELIDHAGPDGRGVAFPRMDRVAKWLDWGERSVRYSRDRLLLHQLIKDAGRAEKNMRVRGYVIGLDALANEVTRLGKQAAKTAPAAVRESDDALDRMDLSGD